MDVMKIIFGCLLTALLAGCRSSPKYEQIEAELRDRDRELNAARSELEHFRSLSLAYQNNLARTADPTSQPGNVPMVPLKEITIGSGTGGANNSSAPGDEALQVMLIPKDDDGSAVKVPGRVVVLAYEISPTGVKLPIGRWDVAPETLRKQWRSTLISTGYFLQMQWDKPPRTGRVRVAVRFTTLDGRVYEADKDVNVKPLPGLAPRTEELPPPSTSQRPAVSLGRVSEIP